MAFLDEFAKKDQNQPRASMRKRKTKMPSAKQILELKCDKLHADSLDSNRYQSNTLQIPVASPRSKDTDKEQITDVQNKPKAVPEIEQKPDIILEPSQQPGGKDRMSYLMEKCKSFMTAEEIEKIQKNLAY